jgi:peptidoglycan/xylan/chitin deacetylase (PgdA/CDA1 family)
MHGLLTAALARLDRRVLWRVRTHGKEVFLTFDDGPEPGVTPWVLDTLARYGAKATFFCLGEQAAAAPELMVRLHREGHATGHHTWDHPNGWRTADRTYYRNVLRGLPEGAGVLFRPPYGHLKVSQLRRLRKRVRIVMWDVLAGDFRPGRSGTDCARKVLRKAVPGSIIVLHDNAKSARCLKEALPLILDGLSRKGYRFSALPRNR